MAHWQEQQKDPYYKVAVDFPKPFVYKRGPNTLEVRVSYKIPFTEKDELTIKKYFQWRLSTQEGKEVPLHEITINKQVGRKYIQRTTFIANYNQPLYCGLILIHSQVPYVLPKIAQSLERYKKEVSLTSTQEKTVDYTISELEKIIQGKTI